MIKEIKSFLYARMNLDAGNHYLKPTDHRKIWNSMLSATRDAGLGYLIKVGGTTNVFTLAVNAGFTLPAGTFVCNGVCDDIGGGTIIYFLCDTTGTNHGIFRMFLETKQCEWILQSPILNFQKKYIISANVVGDLLYWTDGYDGNPFVKYNPPRKINIWSAIGYTNPYDINHEYHTGEYAGYLNNVYQWIDLLPGKSVTPTNPNPKYWKLIHNGSYSNITLQVLDRIKYQPVQAPTTEYSTDTGKLVNLIQGNLFQFRCRYTYDDNEKSVWSDISNLPLPQNSETGTGDYIDNRSLDNCIHIWIQTGSPEVRTIELAARNGNDGVWGIIYTFNKFTTAGIRITGMDDNINILYPFYNDDFSFALDQDDTERLYDFVPQISRTQELIEKNRIIDGDYV
jgi:hypothetical protein